MDNEIFTVIGVMQAEPAGGMRQFEPNRSIFMHATSAQRLLGKADLNEITAQLRPGATTTQARAQVARYFSSLEKKTSVRISSPEEMIAQMEKQMRMFTLLLGAIGSISLIVGGVGVMNVMLVSVTERRREIGIRRALGARRGDIRAQFLVESMILSLLGGAIGIAFGVAASWLIGYFAHWQFAISGGAILLGVGVSCGIGVFFGYYPARQASLLDPIAALRAE
jgi:putative ABC transport system permease protein